MLTLPGMGLGADPQQVGPAHTVVATVGRDRQHQVLNIALESGSQIADGDLIEVEIWRDGERLVMDARDYQPLVDAAPGTDLGPIEPGLFFVDLTAIGSSHPELLDALVGVSPPSLGDLAENLDLEVPLPPAADEDRTDVWRRYLIRAGFDS